MASTAIAPAHDAAPVSPAALPCLVATVAYVVILIVGGNLLNDADSYWHLAVGQWIVDNGFPHADPFSFTFAGHPWIAKEWLSQVLYYGAWHLAGWPGVVLLAAAAIATAFGLLARFLEDRLAPATALVFVAAAFMLVAPHALARPHALAMPVMIGWMGGLLYAAEQKKAPSYWLLPLMVAWANLHGGFVFGIFMVGAFGLDAVAAAAPADRWRAAGAWVRFAILALIAACITPYGPESFLAAFRVLDLGSALNFIDEWRAADFSHLAGLEIALLLGIGFALWRGFTLPWPRIVILVGLIHMALSAERNAELLGLIAPLLIAAPLARQVPAVAAGAELPRRADTLAGVALALLIPLSAAFATLANYAPSASITPTAAVEALTAANARRVFNDYTFGGYLVSRGVPTFIDGRTELFGAKFVARYAEGVSLADLNSFTRMLDTYDIDATLLPPGTPAVALLDMLPGWQRLYADDTAVAHVRTPLRPTLP